MQSTPKCPLKFLASNDDKPDDNVEMKNIILPEDKNNQQLHSLRTKIIPAYRCYPYASPGNG